MITRREQIKGTMLLAMSEHHSGNAEEARKIVDAQLLALEAAGVRMVPETPTDEMAIAGGEAAQRSIGSWGEPELCYRAMLSASPFSPPAKD